MEYYCLRRMVRCLVVLMVPVACLSMGGCPGQGGEGPVCGNGDVENGEECDDGNTANNDGCSSGCDHECGNGTVNGDEECDDGNTEDGDGCNSDCENEDVEGPDSDNDGVPDDTDGCPGTSRGVAVDDVGCPLDADNDGVPNASDDCPDTPSNAEVDENGCELDTDDDGIPDSADACDDEPAGELDENQDGCPDVDPNGDDDEDGVINADDLCADTPTGETPNEDGCSPSQTPPVCGNGTVETGEICDDGNTNNGDGCSSACQNEGGGGGAICGNGAVEVGEGCDDGNTASGDGCSSSCQQEQVGNNFCSDPTAVGEGTQTFSTEDATTDGPEEPVDCFFFNRGDIRSDIWYCYTATCTGQAVVSLCGSGYDTKMAVYSGCDCPDPGPTDRPIACSDDNCGTGIDNTQSRVEINVTAGESFMVRVGGFFGNREKGDGRLTIRCGEDTCVNGVGDCMTAHDDDEPGCSTASCCNRVCEVDTFCCDVTWDDFCASEASGFCTSGFASCSADAGTCDAAQSTPGCSDSECCNAVCETDPYCCINSWDENCTDQSTLVCESCGRGRGDCLAVRTTPGCDDITCCARVCAVDDFCCNTEWDATCVEQAQDVCDR